MTRELEQKLQNKYPKIFRDIYGDKMKTAMAWGIETRDGWYWIIDHLCGSIQNYINNNTHLNIPQVVATQVKEKFGGLRFYYNGGDDIIDGMVTLAENLSYHTCETCGSTKNIGLTKGWIRVLCEDCADVDKEKTNWEKYHEE